MGVVLALVLVPVWLPALARYRWARLYVGLGGATIVWGVVLAELARSGHVVLPHNGYATTFLLVELLVGVGIVLWARLLLPAWQVGSYFSVGLLMHAALHPGVLGATHPLKFSWLIPLAALMLSLIARAHSTAQLAALLALAGLAATADARALFGTALVAAVLLAWQLRPGLVGARASWAWTAVTLAALGLATYNLATTLLINGYLGSATQQRSVDQVDRSGSLLLGGRPELSATRALLRHFPGGFGPGVVANRPEINIAKTGMATINYDPNNGYVDRFMFGTSVELHSTFGDLWAAFGVAGIAFSALIGVIVVVVASRLIAARRATAVLVFFGLWALWNMLFSPLSSAQPTLVLVLGLLMAEEPRRSRADDDLVHGWQPTPRSPSA